jgi:hypothetical protein
MILMARKLFLVVAKNALRVLITSFLFKKVIDDNQIQNITYFH